MAEFQGWGSPRTVLREVNDQATSGVAVDPLSGDVYLDNGGSVAAFTPSGGLIERFGAGELNGASGIAVDAASEQVLVAKPRPPIRSSCSWAKKKRAHQGVGWQLRTEPHPTSTRLQAQIDPKGLATE